MENDIVVGITSDGGKNWRRKGMLRNSISNLIGGDYNLPPNTCIYDQFGIFHRCMLN